MNRKCLIKKSSALNTSSADIILLFIAFPGIYVKRIFLSKGKELNLTVNKVCTEWTSMNYWKGSKYADI
jgi:hypothetical protein